MSSGELFVHKDLQSKSFSKVEYVKVIQTTEKTNIKIHTCILHMHTIHSGRGGNFNAILFTTESDSLPVTDSSQAHMVQADTCLEGTWLEEHSSRSQADTCG